MKYALKPSSRVIDIPASNKMIFFSDEKSLIDFFHTQMKQDLVNPNSKNERLSRWQLKNYKYGINPLDITCVYSILVNQDIDFPFLSYTRRVYKMVREHFTAPKSAGYQYWQILSRMRSIPSNYTLYVFEDYNGGKVLKNVRWGNFWKMAKEQKLFDGISLKYVIPQQE
jgi:hypothetical protein